MRVPVVALFIGLLCISGCSKKEAAPAEPKAEKPAPAPAAEEPAPQAEAHAMDPAAEANEVFSTYCSTCHGAGGKGDGAAAAALEPKPRDLTSAEWQASVTDDHIVKLLNEGGAAVGLSAQMPPWPFAAQKPEVVQELVKVVRGLGQ